MLASGGDHVNFFHLSGPRKEGGGHGRGDTGIYYAFIMALQHPVLQNFVGATLSGNARSSGEVLMPDGKLYSASFLDESMSGASGGGGSKKKN